jgi:hypothetical protein
MKNSQKIRVWVARLRVWCWLHVKRSMPLKLSPEGHVGPLATIVRNLYVTAQED